MEMNFLNKTIYGSCKLSLNLNLSDEDNLFIAIDYYSDKQKLNVGKIVCRNTSIDVDISAAGLEDAIRDIASESIDNGDILVNSKDREYIKFGIIHEFGKAKLMIYQKDNNGWVVLGEYLHEMREILSYDPYKGELYVDAIKCSLVLEDIINYSIGSQLSIYAESLLK